uniref:Rho guanine nucleotide exchange factor 25 n=1 Tax=Mus musculus TaxID=10090 RepID=A0A1W2P718_MOUSE
MEQSQGSINSVTRAICQVLVDAFRPPERDPLGPGSTKTESDCIEEDQTGQREPEVLAWAPQPARCVSSLRRVPSPRRRSGVSPRPTPGPGPAQAPGLRLN